MANETESFRAGIFRAENAPAAPPAYGVRTCGKLAEAPFDRLGPCLRDPGHDGRCRYRAPVLEGAYVEVERVENPPSPFDADPIILKYRRYLRNSLRVSLVACVLSLASCAWSLLRAFQVL